MRAEEGEEAGSPSPSAYHPNPPWSGPNHRVAGGRTSVSAPRGDCRETIVPLGREQIWIGLALRHFDTRPYSVIRRLPSSNIHPGHVLKGRLRPKRVLCPWATGAIGQPGPSVDETRPGAGRPRVGRIHHDHHSEDVWQSLPPALPTRGGPLPSPKTVGGTIVSENLRGDEHPGL